MIALARRDSGHQLTVSVLAPVEIRSAIRRRERMGDLPAGGADTVFRLMDRDLSARSTVQPVTDSLVHFARLMVDRHGLRGYDAVQLAGSLTLRTTLRRSVTLVASDQQLLDAAEAEGFTVYNPEPLA